MDIRLSNLAVLELDDAAEYYNQESPGLGDKFKNEIKKSLERISNYPTSWSVERGDIRKYLVHKFPYKIMYSIEEDHLFIIAIAHQHRKPDYWVGDRKEK